MPCYYTVRLVTYLCIIFNIYCDVLKKYKLVENIMSCDCSIQAWQAETKLRQRKIADSKKTAFNIDSGSGAQEWRRQCGCIRTSDKLKQILKSFPPVPPPSPSADSEQYYPNAQITACYVNNVATKEQRQNISSTETDLDLVDASKVTDLQPYKQTNYSSRLWRILSELFQLLQFSINATALAVYYIIYCYMQLVYFALRSALYFHQADGPMKLTIAVVSLTSLVIGFNMLQRMERLFGIDYMVKQMS